MYRVRKKVFARLPTVSWFGACEDFLPGAVLVLVHLRAGLSTQGGRQPKEKPGDTSYLHICFVLEHRPLRDQHGVWSWSLDLITTHSCPDTVAPTAPPSKAEPVVDLPLPPPPGGLRHPTLAAFGAPLDVEYVPKEHCCGVS